MKKFISFLCVMLIVGFVSCQPEMPITTTGNDTDTTSNHNDSDTPDNPDDPNNPDNPQNPNADVVEEVDLDEAVFWKGSYMSEDLYFLTKDAFDENNNRIKIDIRSYYLSFKSSAPDETLDLGVYTEKDLDLDYSYLYTSYDNRVDKKYTDIKTANIVVETGKFTATITDVNGVVYHITYLGEIKMMDGDQFQKDEPFQLEDKNQTTVDIVFNKLEAGYEDIQSMNFRYLYLMLTDTTQMPYRYAAIELYSDYQSDNYSGTYNFSTSAKVGNAMASKGYDSYNRALYASYVATINNQNGVEMITVPIYYIVSGTVTISEGKIEFDAMSYFGSRLKGSYSGEINPTNMNQ